MSPATYDARARELAKRLGVDPDLPPRQRAVEIARRLGMSALIPKRVEAREPGCDDE